MKSQILFLCILKITYLLKLNDDTFDEREALSTSNKKEDTVASFARRKANAFPDDCPVFVSNLGVTGDSYDYDCFGVGVVDWNWNLNQNCLCSEDIHWCIQYERDPTIPFVSAIDIRVEEWGEVCPQNFHPHWYDMNSWSGGCTAYSDTVETDGKIMTGMTMSTVCPLGSCVCKNVNEGVYTLPGGNYPYYPCPVMVDPVDFCGASDCYFLDEVNNRCCPITLGAGCATCNQARDLCTSCINDLHDPTTNCISCTNTRQKFAHNPSCGVCEIPLENWDDDCASCTNTAQAWPECTACKNPSLVYGPDGSLASSCTVCINPLQDETTSPTECTACKNTKQEHSLCSTCSNPLLEYGPDGSLPSSCGTCVNLLQDETITSPSECSACKNSKQEYHLCSTCSNPLLEYGPDGSLPSSCGVCINLLQDETTSPTECTACKNTKQLYPLCNTCENNLLDYGNDGSIPSSCSLCINRLQDETTSPIECSACSNTLQVYPNCDQCVNPLFEYGSDGALPTSCGDCVNPNQDFDFECSQCLPNVHNYPTCDVMQCNEILSTDTENVCNNHGTCVWYNTCECTEVPFLPGVTYFDGDYCDNELCLLGGQKLPDESACICSNECYGGEFEWNCLCDCVNIDCNGGTLNPVDCSCDCGGTNGMSMYDSNCACLEGWTTVNTECDTPCESTLCRRCSTGDPSFCEATVEGYYFREDDASYHQCCIGCKSCSDSDVCLEAQDSYFVDADDGSVKTCPPNCKQCDADQCFEAHPGYYINENANNAIAPCPIGCVACSTSSTGQVECIEAARGYFLLNGVATACGDPFCIDCTSETVCVSAMEGYYIDANFQPAPCTSRCRVCQGGRIDECISSYPGYYVDASSSGWVVPCALNCLDCVDENTCLLADSGYYVSSGKVYSCEPRCTRCSSDDNCQVSEIGYFVDDDGRPKSCVLMCDICSDAVSCDAASAGYFITDLGDIEKCSVGCELCESEEICMKAAEGWYIDGHIDNQLERCIYNCAKCDDSESCVRAVSGYFVDNGLPTPCVENCLECESLVICTVAVKGYYIENYAPVKCAENCESCASSNVCLVPFPGYYITDSGGLLLSVCEQHCNVCRSLTECLEAGDGYYVNTNGLVRKCNDNCKRCTGTESNQCLLAADGWYVAEDDGVIYACTGNCLKCQNQYYCLETTKGYYVIDGKIFPCIAHCTACYNGHNCYEVTHEDGWYLDTTSTPILPAYCGNGCKKCHLDEGNQNNNVIVCDEVGKGFCYDGIAEAFRRCIVGCDECLCGSGVMDCITAAHGYFLFNEPGSGKKIPLECRSIEGCVACSVTGLCVGAANGFYLNENNQPRVCGSGCLECEMQDNDVICTQPDSEAGYEWNEILKQVVKKCGMGCTHCEWNGAGGFMCVEAEHGYFAHDGGYIGKCPSHCVACTGPKTCKQAENGYYLVDSIPRKCPMNCRSCDEYGMCLQVEKGFYIEFYTGEVGKCGEHCDECVIDGFIGNTCLDIHRGYFNLRQPDIDDWFAGYPHTTRWPIGGEMVEKCEYGCVECNYFDDCILCQSGYGLKDGHCVLCSDLVVACAQFSQTRANECSCVQCESGFQLTQSKIDNSKFVCQACSFDKCIACSDDLLSCEQCIEGYVPKPLKKVVQGLGGRVELDLNVCKWECEDMACLTCRLQSKDYCTSCASGYVRWWNTEHFNYRGVCVACPQGCLECKWRFDCPPGPWGPWGTEFDVRQIRSHHFECLKAKYGSHYLHEGEATLPNHCKGKLGEYVSNDMENVLLPYVEARSCLDGTGGRCRDCRLVQIHSPYWNSGMSAKTEQAVVARAWTSQEGHSVSFYCPRVAYCGTNYGNCGGSCSPEYPFNVDGYCYDNPFFFHQYGFDTKDFDWGWFLWRNRGQSWPTEFYNAIFYSSEALFEGGYEGSSFQSPYSVADVYYINKIQDFVPNANFLQKYIYITYLSMCEEKVYYTCYYTDSNGILRQYSSLCSYKTGRLFRCQVVQANSKYARRGIELVEGGGSYDEKTVLSSTTVRRSSINNNDCVSIHENCVKCIEDENGDPICSLCADGLGLLLDGTCIECGFAGSGCRHCEFTNGVPECVAAFDGWRIDFDTGFAVKCSDSRCKRCVWMDDQSVEICVAANDGFSLDANGEFGVCRAHCKVCNSNTQQGLENCEECMDGYVRQYAGISTECVLQCGTPDDRNFFVSDIGHCEKCSSNRYGKDCRKHASENAQCRTDKDFLRRVSNSGTCVSTRKREPFRFPSYSSSSSSSSLRRQLLQLNSSFVDKTETISMCVNEYWGVYITMGFGRTQLWIWGEGSNTDYIKSEYSEVPQVVDLSEFEPAYSVSCTRTSIFVVTITGKLLVMGDNQDKEMLNGASSSFYELTENNGESLPSVISIATSYHTAYVVLNEIVEPNNYHRVISIGSNSFGEIGNQDVRSDSMVDMWVEVDLSALPKFTVSNWVTLSGTYPVDSPLEGYLYIISPELKAMEHGLWLKYSHNYHLYTGKDHPSLGTDAAVPSHVLFDGTDSQLTGSSVDYVDRLWGGCMYLISENKVYVSGSECVGIPGIEGSPTYSTPQEIYPVLYGEYDQSNNVVSFECGHACYIQLENGNLFFFGSDVYSFAAGDLCEGDCKIITLASSANVYDVIFSKGFTKITNDGALEESIEVLFSNMEGVAVMDDHASTYIYRPEVLFDQSGMVNDTFSIVLRKRDVFKQGTIRLGFQQRVGYNEWVDVSHPMCSYPLLSHSKWNSYSNVVDGLSYTYHYFEMEWKDFYSKCSLTSDVFASNSEFEVFSNRLYYTVDYFKGVIGGSNIVQNEEFFFDIKIRFPRNVLKVTTGIQENREFFSWYVTDRMLDRELRMGIVRFSTVTLYPNILVFDELEGPFPNNPMYFVKNIFSEDNGNTINNGCNENKCVQEFEWIFYLLKDTRICVIPETHLNVKFTTICVSDTHPDCINIQDGKTESITATVSMEINDLCQGEFVMDIETEFLLGLYESWAYKTELGKNERKFEIGDWLYFKGQVSSEKLSVVGVSIEEIRLKVADNDDDIISLLTNGELSQNGEDLSLVIDEIDGGGKDKTLFAFHFQVHNKITKLQPGESKVFAVEVHCGVLYEGNDHEVVSKRRKGNEESDKKEMHQMTSNVKYAIIDSEISISISMRSFEGSKILPYVVLSISAFCAICLIVCILGLFAVTILFRERVVSPK